MTLDQMLDLIPPINELPPVPEFPEIPPETPPDPSVLTGAEQEEFREVLEELASREREALKLFEPMPEQERFFSSDAAERIIRGGNRGGKTLSACVEIARALTGQDPHDKYSKTGLRFIVVGKDLQHCSKVLYRKLFRPGAFKIIKDANTGEWRTFRPDDPEDIDRAHLAKPAPPLIPKRFYNESGLSWENKREEILKSVRLKNGSELSFFSSLAAPPQGWDADCVLFDEEIEHPRWYPEVSARLIDRRQYDRKTRKSRNGKFIWSATPQAGTVLLYELIQRADLARLDDKPSIVEFKMNMGENTFISEGGKAEFAAKFDPDSDEYKIRVLGDFALLGQRVYPGFMPKGVHGCPEFDIPQNWTRYCAIDPGHQVTAVLFIAVPDSRSEWAGQKIIYDELYIKKCDAIMLARRLKDKVGDSGMEAWWIDHRAGRMTQIAAGKTPEEQYSEEFKKIGLRCNRTGHRFSWGSDDVQGGILAVREAFAIRDGKSTWLVMKDRCPNFVWEMGIYSYRKTPKGPVTDEPLKVNDHLCLVGGTQITTSRGQVPIERVEAGDRVLTRRGWRRVVAAGLTQKTAPVIEVHLSSGAKLCGTDNHPVYVIGKGFTPIGDLAPGDELMGVERCQDRSRAERWSSTRGSSSSAIRTRSSSVTGITSRRRRATASSVFSVSIRRSGRTPTGQFPRAITSIIRTATPPTTLWRTWSACRPRTTGSTTSQSSQRSSRLPLPSVSLAIVASRPTGTPPKRVKSGIPRTPKRCGRSVSLNQKLASTAARYSSPGIAELRDSARTTARHRTGGHSEKITSHGSVSSVGNGLSATSTTRPGSAPLRVSGIAAAPKKQPVYNLTVQGQPEYFANGVLVHNCDCARYLALADLKYVKPKPKPKQEGYTNKALRAKRERAAKKSGYGESIKLG